MSQMIKPNEVIYRTATLFLKKENAGNEEDSINIIENSKNMSYTLYSDKFAQVFEEEGRDKKYRAPENADSYEVNMVCDRFVGDHNDKMNTSKVHGMKMREFAVGDIIHIQEWVYDEEAMQIYGRVNRFFMIGKHDFDEFKFSTGEFL